jgi:TfoX/Sxy family transcriptional regulator of competence genes
MEMEWPKPDQDRIAELDANLEGRLERRKMFGHPCYFLRGNMIAGVFGDKVFLRLPPATMKRLQAEGAAEPFTPMGRAMSAYVQMKGASSSLYDEAVELAATLPEKKSKKKA